MQLNPCVHQSWRFGGDECWTDDLDKDSNSMGRTYQLNTRLLNMGSDFCTWTKMVEVVLSILNNTVTQIHLITQEIQYTVKDGFQHVIFQRNEALFLWTILYSKYITLLLLF